jgi:hypothetical protein
MNVQPQRPAGESRSQHCNALISDPDGNLIELMQIRPGSGFIGSESKETAISSEPSLR